MIKYYNLFKLLNDRNMKKTDLLKIISSPTLAKLSKGDIIKTDTINKICEFLQCQPANIMEYVEISRGYDKDTKTEYIIEKKPNYEDETEEEIFEADDYKEINSDI